MTPTGCGCPPRPLLMVPAPSVSYSRSARAASYSLLTSLQQGQTPDVAIPRGSRRAYLSTPACGGSLRLEAQRPMPASTQAGHR